MGSFLNQTHFSQGVFCQRSGTFLSKCSLSSWLSPSLPNLSKHGFVRNAAQVLTKLPNILRQLESNSLIDTGLHRACPWEWRSWPVRTFSPTQNSDPKDVTHICDQQTCLYLKIKRKTDNSLCKMQEHASKCPLLKFIKQKRYSPALTPFVLANFWS